MISKAAKNKCQSQTGTKKVDSEVKATSYRLKCAKTANGLSHYVMYGDVDKKQALLWFDQFRGRFAFVGFGADEVEEASAVQDAVPVLGDVLNVGL